MAPSVIYRIETPMETSLTCIDNSMSGDGQFHALQKTGPQTWEITARGSGYVIMTFRCANDSCLLTVAFSNPNVGSNKINVGEGDGSRAHETWRCMKPHYDIGDKGTCSLCDGKYIALFHNWSGNPARGLINIKLANPNKAQKHLMWNIMKEYLHWCERRALVVLLVAVAVLVMTR